MFQQWQEVNPKDILSTSNIVGNDWCKHDEHKTLHTIGHDVFTTFTNELKTHIQKVTTERNEAERWMVGYHF